MTYAKRCQAAALTHSPAFGAVCDQRVSTWLSFGRALGKELHVYPSYEVGAVRVVCFIDMRLGGRGVGQSFMVMA